MPTTIGSVTDGYGVTVNQLVGNPLLIPARIIQMLNNQWLSEVVFRDAGGSNSAVVAYEESTPLFLAGSPEDISEFGEIPVTLGQRGIPKLAVGVKRGLGVRVSREMRDENRLDDVNRQLVQLVNTMIRAEENALLSLVQSVTIPSITASATWSTTGTPRKDGANAMEVISAAIPPGGTTQDTLGFVPDTIILPGNITPVLETNADFLSVYAYAAHQNEDIRYTGVLPGTFMGMRVLRTRFWPTTKALVLQSGVAGFYSNVRPLEVTPLYPEGNGPNGGPTESWRTDTTRKRVFGFDQPLAACWINGIQ